MSDTPGAGPILKRGVKKKQEHKPSKIKEGAGKAYGKARDAVFGEGKILGSTRKKMYALLAAGLIGIGWGAIDWSRDREAIKDAAEEKTAREKEERETLVDQFTFWATAQMVGSVPNVKFLRNADLAIDKCETIGEHSLKLNAGQPVFAGNGFFKFNLRIEGQAHEKPVKFEVLEEVFADGAEREYELTARRVDLPPSVNLPK